MAITSFCLRLSLVSSCPCPSQWQCQCQEMRNDGSYIVGIKGLSQFVISINNISVYIYHKKCYYVHEITFLDHIWHSWRVSSLSIPWIVQQNCQAQAPLSSKSRVWGWQGITKQNRSQVDSQRNEMGSSFFLKKGEHHQWKFSAWKTNAKCSCPVKTRTWWNISKEELIHASCLRLDLINPGLALASLRLRWDWQRVS